MKKLIPVLLILLLLLFGYLDYKYTRNKYKDVSYAAERYVTTGISNPYKLNSIDTLQLTFSDSQIAVITVSGTEKSAPGKKKSYKIFAEKKKSGVWKIKKIYPVS